MADWGTPSGSAAMFHNYVQKSTQRVITCLEMAFAELVSLRQNVLTPDFLLVALLSQPDSEARKIVEELLPNTDESVNRIIGKIRQHYQQAAAVHGQQIVAAPNIPEVFRIAYGEAKNLGDDYIGTGTLFIALFDEAAGSTATLLKNEGITAEQARHSLKGLRGGRVLKTQDAESKQDVLEIYTKDLTEKARNGELDPVIGRGR